jgi:Hydrogenase maturation factor
VAFVPEAQAEAARSALAPFAPTARAAVIGEVRDGPAGEVSCEGPLGVPRIIDMLSGEQLPRIC